MNRLGTPTLWQLLDDPAMTRRLMRREISELCKRVEERGPGELEVLTPYRCKPCEISLISF
jgi:hypothetical protein